MAIANLEEALERYREGRLDPRRETLIEGEETREFETSREVIEALEWRRPHSGRIEVDWGGGEGGLLVVSEAWAPGWRARADGVELPLRPANIVAQAVAVPPGTETVRLDYAPTSFRLGLGLSILGLVAILALSLRLRIRPRHRD